jgi:hypothetical protein
MNAAPNSIGVAFDTEPGAVESVSKVSFAAPKARNVEAWAIGPGTSSIKFPSAESA